MSNQPDGKQRGIASSGGDGERPGALTRRTVLAGAAAATAVATISDMDTPASAQAANPTQDMVAFVLLSGILTGIAENKLAQGFRALTPSTPISLENFVLGADPFNVKQEYFNWLRGTGQPQDAVRQRRAATFGKLLQIMRDNLGAPNRDQVVIDKVRASDDTKYLARSIVLMWYLGAWYDPDHLQALEKNPALPALFQVISPNAYSQSWALKVAQAHPMGYSEMQFGYWHSPPQSIDKFIGTRA